MQGLCACYCDAIQKEGKEVKSKYLYASYWCWLVTRWFDLEWYRFLFSKNFGVRNIVCRFRGHPHGVVWYSSGEALEPDMTCKNCGEDLGR